MLSSAGNTIRDETNKQHQVCVLFWRFLAKPSDRGKNTQFSPRQETKKK